MSVSSRDRLRIAVDLDGVLAESMLVWCERANKEFGTSFRIEDLDSWSWWRTSAISRDDFYRILDECWEDWEEIPPTEPGIAGKVQRVWKFGELDVVTGRSRRTEEAARLWIEHQKVRYNRFVRVSGWRDKLCLDYDVYIDDAPDLMPLISRKPGAWAVLYDRPWNRTVPGMPKVLRTEGWKHIPGLLEQVRAEAGRSQT